MKSSYIPLKKFETGKPGRSVLKKNRRKFSSHLPGNYSTLLQLYYLNKKQALPKKELTYTRLTSGKAGKKISKPSFSISAWVASFLTINVSLLKKVKQGIALVTE
jgi:hypothetical protein